MDHDPFHPGEHMVQAQAGVQVQAQRIGQSIKTFLPTAAQDFLQRQQMVIVASIDTEHQVWASILTGDPGCITVWMSGQH
ncbi:MAG: hypothetical protein HC837_05890 [Chloroflexaceae bacterium]|nr:hypothetical protein [Chloroflexaceae bacterium]